MTSIEPCQGDPSFLKALRRAEEPFRSTEPTVQNALIQLRLDERGAYLQTVDQAGRPANGDFRTCRGAMRDLLRAITAIRRRMDHLVGWDTDAERISIFRMFQFNTRNSGWFPRTIFAPARHCCFSKWINPADSISP